MKEKKQNEKIEKTVQKKKDTLHHLNRYKLTGKRSQDADTPDTTSCLMP